MDVKSKSLVFKSKLVLIGLAFAIPSLQSQAGTSSTVMAVSVTVLTACVVSATPLAFGAYDTNAGVVDGSASINVACTGGSSYTIALGAGLGAGATLATRKMSTGLGTLNYSIYTDNTYVTVWGDGTGSSAVVSGSGILGTKIHNVYGRIPATQAVNQGVYTDVVSVNLSY